MMNPNFAQQFLQMVGNIQAQFGFNRAQPPQEPLPQRQPSPPTPVWERQVPRQTNPQPYYPPPNPQACWSPQFFNNYQVGNPSPPSYGMQHSTPTPYFYQYPPTPPPIQNPIWHDHPYTPTPSSSPPKSPTELGIEKLTKTVMEMSEMLEDTKNEHAMAIRNIESKMFRMKSCAYETMGSSSGEREKIVEHEVQGVTTRSGKQVGIEKPKKSLWEEQVESKNGGREENGPDGNIRDVTNSDEDEFNAAEDEFNEFNAEEQEEVEGEVEPGVTELLKKKEEAASQARPREILKNPNPPRYEGTEGIIPRAPKTFDVSQLPYPPNKHRKSIRNASQEKFIDLLKKLEVNLPLVDLLVSTPSYMKFLKNLVGEKKG